MGLKIATTVNAERKMKMIKYHASAFFNERIPEIAIRMMTVVCNDQEPCKSHDC